MLGRAGTAAERLRAVAASLVTAGVIWGVARWTDFGPHGGTPMFLDSSWLFSIVGGIVAYFSGRSRRAAFVAGVLGLVLFQIVDVLLTLSAGGRRHFLWAAPGFSTPSSCRASFPWGWRKSSVKLASVCKAAPYPRPEPLNQPCATSGLKGPRQRHVATMTITTPFQMVGTMR